MPDSPLQVVCAVIIQNGYILATRRDASRSFPMLWEFPGGKIENSEKPAEALERELLEELHFRVKILKQLSSVPYQEDDHHLELIPFLCEPHQEHAPRPVDHQEIRWIRPQELGKLDWAPADLPVLKQITSLLPQIPLDPSG